MIGTAPRSPAQDRKTCSLIGIRNAVADTNTDTGRATKVRKTPAASAISTSRRFSRSGTASRPSITNSPIWAIQPMPSTNDRVAPRCGSWALPSISAQA